MLNISVLPPIKLTNRYEFRCILRGNPVTVREALRRCKAVLKGYGSLTRSILRFGYCAENFEIRHSEIWDSVYPLMFLIRNGGPLFNKGHNTARINFGYQISRHVRDFYIERAANFGIKIEVEGPTYERTFDLPTAGHVLAFGGGKDSRMLLGVLREVGLDPTVITAGKENVPDIPEALVTTPLTDALGDRLMPALMQLGSHFYIGSGLGEAHRETPWQQYFDWASSRAQYQLSQLLSSLGIKMRMEAPACVLPYNIIQYILADRYPELFRWQRSVQKDEPTQKNLHVALCEYLHNIPFQNHCNEALFRKLLKEFVSVQTSAPDDFGYRNYREPINREMRAIIHEKQADDLFSGIAAEIPPAWHGPWIQYIHTYVAPDLNPEILAIYRKYASPIDETSSSQALWRIPI